MAWDLSGCGKTMSHLVEMAFVLNLGMWEAI